MKKYTIFIASLLLSSSALLAETAAAQSTSATPEELEPVMCTMDVRQCPDGTFVGRTGPQCEFMCPEDTTSEPSLMTDPAPTDSETAEAVEARRIQFEDNQEVRQELRTDRRTALSEIRQQRIINLAANISNRMDAAVDRLFAIVGRLESRIAKLELTGVDATTARATLQAATQSLAEARILLSDIDSFVLAATTSEEPVTAWHDVRTRYQSIATLIRSAHTSLRESLATLKTPVPVETETEPAPDTTSEDVYLPPTL